MRYGQPVEACGTLLNPEAPGSYKIIYSAFSPPDALDAVPESFGRRSTSPAVAARAAPIRPPI
jgi:hypothetical protein